jgi:hypothetical protein
MVRNALGTSIGFSIHMKAERGDRDAPLLLSIVIPANGLTMAMTYNEALDTGSVPATGDFSVSGTSAGVSSVGVSGAVVKPVVDAVKKPIEIAYKETSGWLKRLWAKVVSLWKRIFKG